MANDFSGNPWIIDTLDGPSEDQLRAERAGGPRAPKPPKCDDTLRVRRVTYLGGAAGDEVLIHDKEGRDVWNAFQQGTDPIVDDVNLPGGRLNWDGLYVVKMGTGRLLISYL